MENRSSN